MKDTASRTSRSATSRHIVVLHGWTLEPSVIEKWQPFVKLLQTLGLTVHFWPLPGLTVSTDHSFTLAEYVDWLADQTRKLPPFLLLGHSFGGQLAVRFAARFPDRVQKLILIASSGITDSTLPKIVKRSVFKTFAKMGKVILPSDSLRKFLYRAARESDYYQANLAQRETMKSILADQIVADLPKVAAPTLLIWGAQDTVTPPRLAAIFERQIPQAELVMIPKARHSPMYTHPQDVLTEIKRFVQ